jgi:hypothetical protein
LPQTKKIITHTFRIRGTLVFLCPKERERDKERERAVDSEDEERERKDKDKNKEKEKREREREKKVPAIIFLNRLGQNEKSAKY